MTASSNAKLTELRCKTNRDLASLIGNKLERGLAFARMLKSRHFHDRAEREFAEVEAWMPLLTEATPLVRRRLESKCAELRQVLDQNAAHEFRARAAC